MEACPILFSPPSPSIFFPFVELRVGLVRTLCIGEPTWTSAFLSQCLFQRLLMVNRNLFPFSSGLLVEPDLFHIFCCWDTLVT